VDFFDALTLVLIVAILWVVVPYWIAARRTAEGGKISRRSRVIMIR
jgi:hypothetical protein